SDNRCQSRLYRLDRLKERSRLPPNEGYRTGSDEQDSGRSGRVHPPVSDKPACGVCRQGDDWPRRQSFRRSRSGKPHLRLHLGILPCTRQTVVTLTFRGRAISGHGERKSVAATRYVLNAALAVGAIVEGAPNRRYMDGQVAFLDNGIRPDG